MSSRGDTEVQRGEPSADADLVVRLLAGDEDAFRTIVAEWGPGLLRTARYYLPWGAAAEEAVQETWTAVLSGLDGFQGRSSLKTWVFRVLVNQARSRAVREARMIPWSALGDGWPGMAAPGRPGAGETAAEGWISVAHVPWHGAPEPAALAREARQILTAALLRLPDRQRAVVMLRDVYGYTGAEICDLLQLTPVNQRVLLHRGRAALRDGINWYYLERRRAMPEPGPMSTSAGPPGR